MLILILRLINDPALSKGFTTTLLKVRKIVNEIIVVKDFELLAMPRVGFSYRPRKPLQLHVTNDVIAVVFPIRDSCKVSRIRGIVSIVKPITEILVHGQDHCLLPDWGCNSIKHSPTKVVYDDAMVSDIGIEMVGINYLARHRIPVPLIMGKPPVLSTAFPEGGIMRVVEPICYHVPELT